MVPCIPPLTEDATIKVEQKRKREAEAEATMGKKEKKVAHFSWSQGGVSLPPSTRRT